MYMKYVHKIQIQVRGVQDKSTWDIVSQNEWWFYHNMWIWAVATRFVLAQGTLQATKVNFVLLAKQKKNLIGIGPPYRL